MFERNLTMGNVKADMSMSLDGIIAGPNDAPGHPLGEGGDRLHQWVYGLKSVSEPRAMDGGDTGPVVTRVTYQPPKSSS
jgi:hypothetical protein